MRIATILVAALLSASALTGLAFGQTAGAGKQAEVHIVGDSPLRLKGTSFKKHERVSVRVFASQTWKRVVTANRKGVFFATVRGVNYCDSITVLAIGNRGSRASFNRSWFTCGVAP